MKIEDIKSKLTEDEWAFAENYLMQVVDKDRKSLNAANKQALEDTDKKLSAAVKATSDLQAAFDTYKGEAEKFVATAENIADGDLPDDKKLAGLLAVLKIIKTPAIERQQAALRQQAAELLKQADSLTL